MKKEMGKSIDVINCFIWCFIEQQTIKCEFN